jgi:energy-coupling factor transporter ATP-binding protein EcfA2
MTVGTFGALYKVYSRVGKDVGALNKAVSTMVRATSALRSMVALLNSKQDENRRSLTRTLEFASLYHDQNKKDPPDPTAPQYNGVMLEDCSFLSHNGTAVLDDCTAYIPGGRIYELVGGHGEGKYVTCRLLSGNLQPDSGLLFIPPFWKGAMVPRENVVLPGGLRANLCVYHSHASWDDLKQLALRCGIREEVWSGNAVQGRKDMLKWSDDDREHVLAKTLRKATTAVLEVPRRSSSKEFQVDEQGPRPEDPKPAWDVSSPSPSAPQPKSPPQPSLSQHLIMGVLRAIAADPDLLVIVPDLRHLPKDAPLREVLLTWQRKGLSGVVGRDDGPDDPRTLILAGGLTDTWAPNQGPFLQPEGRIRVDAAKLVVEENGVGVQPGDPASPLPGKRRVQ